MFIFACKGPQDKGTPGEITEEFKVNFSVDGGGGEIFAETKDGNKIYSGAKVDKYTQIIFTATPSGRPYSIESWKLDGVRLNETEK